MSMDCLVCTALLRALTLHGLASWYITGKTKRDGAVFVSSPAHVISEARCYTPSTNNCHLLKICLHHRWVGGSEKLVRGLFTEAEAELAACNGDVTRSALHVVVIDEIDAVFRRRSAGEDSGEQTRVSRCYCTRRCVVYCRIEFYCIFLFIKNNLNTRLLEQ